MSEQLQNKPCQSPVLASGDKRTVCVNGCGFFGHPTTSDYCSKCFKDVNGKKETPTLLKLTPVTLQEHAPLPYPPPTIKTETETKLESKDSTITTPATKPKKKQVSRCASCRRKVGVLGFECRCDGVFCGEHRLPHDHKCVVDVKKIQQAKVEKENPLIEHHKFEKI